MPIATRRPKRSTNRDAELGLMTYEEFLRWDCENQHVEWLWKRPKNISVLKQWKIV